MLKINVKELVLKEIARNKRYSQLTKQEKINDHLDSMKFNIRMYNKHRKAKNNRYDKKSLNYNQWTLLNGNFGS